MNPYKAIFIYCLKVHLAALGSFLSSFLAIATLFFSVAAIYAEDINFTVTTIYMVIYAILLTSYNITIREGQQSELRAFSSLPANPFLAIFLKRSINYLYLILPFSIFLKQTTHPDAKHLLFSYYIISLTIMPILILERQLIHTSNISASKSKSKSASILSSAFIDSLLFLLIQIGISNILTKFVPNDIFRTTFALVCVISIYIGYLFLDKKSSSSFIHFSLHKLKSRTFSKLVPTSIAIAVLLTSALILAIDENKIALDDWIKVKLGIGDRARIIASLENGNGHLSEEELNIFRNKDFKPRGYNHTNYLFKYSAPQYIKQEIENQSLVFREANFFYLLERDDTENLLDDIGEQLSDTFDINGDHILHAAAKLCNGTALNQLIKIQNTINVTNKNNQTPLQVAVKERCWPAVTVLTFHGANLNHVDNDNRTALDLASGDRKLIAYLVSLGAKKTKPLKHSAGPSKTVRMRKK